MRVFCGACAFCIAIVNSVNYNGVVVQTTKIVFREG